MIKVKIVNITETQSELAKNPHVVKLRATQEIAHAFGKSVRTKTYYISTDAKGLKVDQELDLDLGLFDVRTSPFEYANEDGVAQTANIDWLVPKMNM